MALLQNWVSSSGPYHPPYLQIAGVFEFVGAVALGGQVTKTVKGSITTPAYFEKEPQVRPHSSQTL